VGQAMRVTNGPGMRRNGGIPWSILAVLMVVLSGCSRTDSESPTTLRLSMIPTTDPGKIIRESKPFVEYLQRKVGAKVELTVPTNYAAVVEAISNDRWCGGASCNCLLGEKTRGAAMVESGSHGRRASDVTDGVSLVLHVVDPVFVFYPSPLGCS
jgi:ABC transporter, phosphonate, periplasmic substrate-binding protein